MIDERSRPIDRAFVTWLLLLYGGWTLAWIAHEALVRGPLTELADRTTDTAYWLACKLLIWFGPTVIFIRRETGAANSLDWLGLRTLEGVLPAIVVSAVWLGIQAALDFVAGNRLPATPTADAALANALVVAPLLEEILFRGFALRRLRDRGAQASVAIFFTAIAWALLHVPGWLFQGHSVSRLPVEAGGITIFGIVLGALRLWVPSLWAPILVHFINNAWHQGVFVWLFRGAS